MGTITKDFSYYEFEKSDIAEAKGITNVITTFEVRDAITALVTEILQPLRDAWGKPMCVNSGYRCAELNVAVGGVPTSQHVKGEAADIATDDPYSLANLARDLNLPYDQMILYPDFVHFSHKLIEVQRKQILYNKRYSGKKL